MNIKSKNHSIKLKAEIIKSWKYGEWNKLTQFESDDSYSATSKVLLMALKSSAYFQLGKCDIANHLAEQALKSGFPRHLLAHILIGGIYNSFGRFAMISDLDEMAFDFYEKSYSYKKLIFQNYISNEF